MDKQDRRVGAPSWDRFSFSESSSAADGQFISLDTPTYIVSPASGEYDILYGSPLRVN